MWFLFLVCVSSCFSSAFGSIRSTGSIEIVNARVESQRILSFFVFLKHTNLEELESEFLAVSNPRSTQYGSYLTRDQSRTKYGATSETKSMVAAYFGEIPGSRVQVKENNVLQVSAPVKSIENHFNTHLRFVKHKSDPNSRKFIRADRLLQLSPEISNHVAFTSLNAPVHYKTPAVEDNKIESQVNVESTYPYAVSVSGGNDDATIGFNYYCSDGSLNNYNPPCANIPGQTGVNITIYVVQYKNDLKTPELTMPFVFYVENKNVECFYPNFLPCNGNTTLGGSKCTCLTRIAILPKYVQLRAVVFTKTFPSTTEVEVGFSPLFVLTDTVTADVLSQLYNIPQGLRVKYGSNQSVVEFLGQFYSNSDLSSFLSLSGLNDASIPTSNVFGDLANDPSNPGGEAQLDVEYIMALAPNATTYFYSFSDLNPYSSQNEGFLAYLDFVESQANPALVQSISYGDIEAEIYNSTNSAAYAYATSCDQWFQVLGLRGISFIVSSGDDGIGNVIVRDDPTLGCSQAWPAWPASSPYVTSVGGTQYTNQYLPVCGQNYATSYTSLPAADRKTFVCSGVRETVCSSTIGGIITSGGGFSDVYNRNSNAPWQKNAVDAYLQLNQSLPPNGYYNSNGRGYPDVATYASNYFVYIDGEITRESGTSASAPTFAAMVTLFNDLRAAYNLPPMGFVAPYLYEVFALYPYAFNDITTGNNACGAGYSVETANCCEYSFSATPGWDAVTGLGSPNFAILSNLVLNKDMTLPFPTVTTAVAITETNAAATTTTTSSSSKDHVTKGVAIAALIFGIVSLLLLFVVFHYLIRKINTITNSSGGYVPLNK